MMKLTVDQYYYGGFWAEFMDENRAGFVSNGDTQPEAVCNLVRCIKDNDLNCLLKLLASGELEKWPDAMALAKGNAGEIKTFSDYAEALTKARTKGYPMCNHNMVYPALKLAGESGELADKIGKHWRNESKRTSGAFENNEIAAMSAKSMSPEFKLEVIKEMGDVLWYLWAMCEEMSISLAYVAEVNVCKVTDRAERNVVCSTGDNR